MRSEHGLSRGEKTGNVLALRRKVANVVEAQQRLHEVVEERVKKNHERQRQAASKGKLPNLTVGDYVMVARVRRPGSTLKLVSTWTGPLRIVTTLRTCVRYTSGPMRRSGDGGGFKEGVLTCFHNGRV